MSLAAGILNVVLGSMYLIVAYLVASEIIRGWKQLGYTHFAFAFLGLALTCGPHHLFHGIHQLFEGREGGLLDLVAALVGAPAGAVFVYLRLEAHGGGRGDRLLMGTPRWIQALPSLGAAYLTALVAITIATSQAGNLEFVPYAIPNILLVGLYLRTGYFLMRTQLRNRGLLGGWSASGLSLALVFPTCAMMHDVFILYAMNGTYEFDIHGFVVDWISVPTAIYFLWVIRSMYRQTLGDWSHEPTQSPDLTIESSPSAVREPS